MKFDLGWLRELVDPAPDPNDAAERLTACGFLVEVRDRVPGGEVWEVEVTTNRPDAMNHRGLARELAVATGGRLRPIDVGLSEDGEPAAALASVEIVEPELCSRYVARLVRGVTITESPDWLRQRLERCGVRPINAVVDATNYVLLELGQPLHAFDLARLAGRAIVVRRPAPGERLDTLDGEPRQLDPDTLVIADADRPVALAGIMGGADSEISEGTSDILIESASFDALTVRRAARRLGMHTEASHRFERGCDPEMAGPACDVAAALIAELCGGRVARGRIDVEPRPWRPRELALSVAELSRFAGLDIEGAAAERILAGLEFAPRRDGDRIVVTPPSWRVDVERVADLYEEVIRHVGYGAIPARLPVLETRPGHRAPSWELTDRARDAAVAVGLAEVMTFSFGDDESDLLAGELPINPGPSIALANPLAVTQSVMRRSLLPGMLAAARANLNRGERTLAVFEQGRVFFVEDGMPAEKNRLGVVLSGSRAAWPDAERPVDFADLKGDLDGVFERLGSSAVEWRPGGGPWLDERQRALLVADREVIGYAGRLSDERAARWDLKQATYVAEIELAAFAPSRAPVLFEPLQRFPAVVADMTVQHSATLAFADLVEAVRELAGELVETVALRDRYAGVELPDGAVRTTMRLTYRHPERSLTQDEVNTNQVELRERLAERLGVTFA